MPDDIEIKPLIADGKARTQEHAPPDKRDIRRRLQWKRIERWALALFTGLPALFIAGWLVISLTALLTHRHNLDIDEIGVPETLSKAGFTSDVATRRLRDAIIEVQQASQTTMTKSSVDTNIDAASITIPDTGLTLGAIAATIRNFFPSWRKEISGEFIEADGHLSLRVRLNGETIFYEFAQGISADAAMVLIGDATNGAGFAIVRETQPYLIASAVYADGKGDAQHAEAMADGIIARMPTDDENVSWAYNLKGNIALESRHDYKGAKGYYEKAPSLAVTHANLALILSNAETGFFDLELALKEATQAVNIDPSSWAAHYRLADVLLTQARYKKFLGSSANSIRKNAAFARLTKILEEGAPYKMLFANAIAEYRKAGELNRGSALPPEGLADLYRYENEPTEAVREYQIALMLDGSLASAHSGLGLAYLDLSDLDEAIAELGVAIKLNPHDNAALDNLGLIYELRDDAASDDPANATKQYAKAIDIYPKDAWARYHLANIWLKQLSDAPASSHIQMLNDACLMLQQGDALAKESQDYNSYVNSRDTALGLNYDFRDDLNDGVNNEFLGGQGGCSPE